MKKYIAILSFILICFSAQLKAKIKFGSYEHIKTVAKMPKTEEFLLKDIALVGDHNQQLKIDNQDYMNLGVKYTSFNFAGMPYWITQEPILVGTSSLREDMYYDLTPQEAEIMLKQAKISKKEALALSFWEKYTGWVVSLIVLALVFIYYAYFGKEDENNGGYHDNGDIIREKTD